MSEPRAFWGWPGWDLLGHALLLGGIQTLWWALIYNGADWLTSLHNRRVRIHLDAELQIPFVPAMVIGYLSINLLFVMAPFILRTRQELQALTATLAVVIFVAGIGFLLVPSEPAFTRANDSGGGVLSVLLAFAKRVALRHNMVPSLHLALATVCVAAYADRAELICKGWLWTWAAVIAASTLLIHQHHVIDVVTGLALAWGGKWFIYDAWLRRSD